PHLERHVSNPQRARDEKAIIYVHEEFPEKIATAVPVSAILLSSVSDQNDQSVLSPIGTHAAMQTLIKTTAQALKELNTQDFFALYKACMSVPTYKLQCGTNLPDLNSKLIDLLNRLIQSSYRTEDCTS
ncbi:MAG: hypothetical protein ACRD3W_07065, partial [Terriglobales bacterium]